MEWKIVSAEVWMASTDITWERECDGYNQRLAIQVADEKMYCRAYHWAGISKPRSFYFSVPRRHVMTNQEVSALYNEVYFYGIGED